MRNIFLHIIYNQKGQGLVEYSLIVSIIILAVLGTIQLFGAEVIDLLRIIETETTGVI